MITSAAPARPSAAAPRCDIRPLQPGDGLEIRRLFRATIGLQRPHGIEYADLVSYEQLCIAWYLTIGRTHARVVEHAGEIVGYLLVCLDQPAYDAWARRRTIRWVGRAAYRLATGQLGADARRFAALHLSDVTAGRRLGLQRRFPAHARFHVAADRLDERLGRRLVSAVDELVELAGLSGWYAEVDVSAGASLGVFARDGAQIVSRMPNRTSSWIRGTAVHRVTVARGLANDPLTVRPVHRHPARTWTGSDAAGGSVGARDPRPGRATAQVPG